MQILSANPFILFNYKLKIRRKHFPVGAEQHMEISFRKLASLEEVVLVHERQFEAFPTQMNRERLHKVKAEMIKYLAVEEEFWKQKAGMLWFKDGDRNTKFFHAQVRGRRKKLQLRRIQNNMGIWIEEEEQIAEEAVSFYKDQFTESVVPSTFHIIDHVPTLVEEEQNARLTELPTKEEVRKAVYGLNGDSAGGPDGFTGAFYHTCWDIVGEDIYAMAGFVKGRSIVENILLTQEIITDIRLRTKAGPNVVMKLDMTKAYDRLSWLFLTKVLRKLGFCERFIGMIFDLVGNN
ncbi:PREDICTED: uncharacterized protein LOC109222830, partial [Nicotiana attenuata]|uniref:uncharacterized protein LOC109222830 n=1 Tax=Nicotiana attenuata TaxID=49451 RepID=UPI0009053AA5